MPSKNSANNKDVLNDLEKKISPVLIVNNSSLKPYVELFDYAPENIYQQPLGSLVGFFEVREYSQDSAYVVNFLTSVLKKEYYINPKRPVTESLDSALHKVNMALSELANQGNVEWLGKLNAAICVLEKNNAHFSVAGKAKIFLYRGQGLTEISEDLASESLEPHPLKTFVNVSSGRMEKDDRLLITVEDIFHILSAIELKKNFQRFSGDKFVQFLKTALSNQMEMIASIVVEMIETEVLETAKAKVGKKPSRTANVFSEKTFAEKTDTTLSIEESLQLMDVADQDVEYTDKKTGHIYVQGETSQSTENAKVALFWENVKEKTGEAWYLAKNGTRRRLSLYKKQLAKKRQLRLQEKEKLAQLKEEELKRQHEEKILQDLEREQQLALEKEAQKVLAEKQKLAQQEADLVEKQRQVQRKLEQEEENRKISELQQVQLEQIEQDKIEENSKRQEEIYLQPLEYDVESQAPLEDFQTREELSFMEKLRRAKLEQQRLSAIDLRATQKNNLVDLRSNPEKDSVATLSVPIHLQAEIETAKKEKRNEEIKKLTQKVYLQAKNILSAFLAHSEKITAGLARRNTEQINENEGTHIVPRFSKIKKSFSTFTFNQKIYTFIALIAIFIVPLFIVHFLNQPKKPTIASLQATKPAVPANPLTGEKNIALTPQKQILSSRSDISSQLVTNVGMVAFTKSSVLMFSGNQAKEYPIPTGEGSILKATFMSDLSLVLIMTDQNKIISFSPISLKFIDNNITLPADAASDYIGTYMTYLYILDPSANQIYRYPRADGGFGDKTNWLKTASSLSNVSNMTIDDSIYTIQNNQIFKFFQGKGQPLSLEASHTPVHYDKIYTTLNSTYLWILDTQNSRIVSFDKSSYSIVSQYYSDVLKAGTSLSVDEKNKAAYVTTPNGLVSITIQ